MQTGKEAVQLYRKGMEVLTKDSNTFKLCGMKDEYNLA